MFSVGADRQASKMRLFVAAWAWAETMQILCLPTQFLTVPGWPLQGCVVWLFLRPRASAALVAFLLAAFWRTVAIMPFVPNHLLFMLFINLILLVSCIEQFCQNRTFHLDYAKLFAAFAPPARTALLILYLFAVLAKLNTDYFNTDFSCAVVYISPFRIADPSTSFASAVSQITIYASLGLEILIPVLLYFKTTRSIGVVIALVFHLLLGLHPTLAIAVMPFTFCIFAILILFLPDDWFRRITARYKLISARKPLCALACAIVIGLVFLNSATVIASTEYFNAPFSYDRLVRLHTLVFIPNAMTAIWFLGFGILSYRSKTNLSVAGSSERHRSLAWLVLLLLIGNGMCPYIGLKTTTSMTMFSNLRTEKGLGNHQLIPTAVRIFEFQDQLAQVVESNDPLLQPYVESGDWLTVFELRRICNRQFESTTARTYRLDFDGEHRMFKKLPPPPANVYVGFQLNGRYYYESLGQPNTTAFEPLGFWERRFLAFRPITNPHGPACCDH